MPKRFDSFTFPSAVSLATPACRCVAVQSWAEVGPDGTAEVHTEFVPVVALAARVETRFSRPHRPDGYHRPPTPELADREGWHCEGADVVYDALVVEPEFGLIPAADDLLDGVNTAYVVAAAPWPPEEDPERLARLVKRVEKQALEAMRRHDRQQADARTAAAG